MIKVNELRIGNWVNVNSRPEQIFQLQAAPDVVINAMDETLLSQLSLIPLSPEWLERFGYIKSSQEAYKHSCGVWLNVKDDGVFYIYGMRSDRYIRFVHELQNAVFALTGEEIEIKTTPEGDKTKEGE